MRTPSFAAMIATGFLAAAVSIAAPPVVIINGTVHTLAAAGVIEHGSVLIENGRIAAVGANVAIPPGARVIDAHEHDVTPGLMNSYTVLGLDEVIENAEDTVDSSSPKGVAAASFDVRYGINRNSVAIPIARLQGLTRAIAAPSAAHNVFAGVGAELRLDAGDDMLQAVGIGMFVDLGPNGRQAAGGSRSAAWAQLLAALAEARRYDQDRAGYERGSHAPYILARSELEALGPVIRQEMPLVVLADRESDIRNLLRLQEQQHVRVILIGGAEAWRVALPLAAAHIPVVLNPSADLPYNFDAIGSSLSNAALLHSAGVLIAFSGSFGFDGGPYNVGRIGPLGGLAAANGLPREAALAAMTIDAARIWGIDRQYGSLEQGKDADLVVWDGDPLEPSSGTLLVMIGGAEQPLVSRQTLLRDRYQRRAPEALPPGYQK